MANKQDALIEVTELIRRHNLSLEDISLALKGTPAFQEQKSSSILSKILGYIGGIFVFSGLCIFTAMQWDEMNAYGHILVTLGVGFCTFILAVVATKDARYEKAATPLFLMAALLQPAGIIVVLKEFAQGGDPEYGFLFMTAVMLVQQGLVFMALRRTVLLFMALFFGSGMFMIAFDIAGVPDNIANLVIGVSLLCLSWTIDKTEHHAITHFYYLTGSIAFLVPLFDMLRNTPFEVLYLGVTCGIIFISTLVRSRALLFVGTASTVCFIGYFSDKYFKNTLGWPITLMVMGLVLIGMSALAIRINRKYILQKG